MNAVGRLGSYISRGVYTVSGPFHPFGGAVDIIVVQQPDGSFKSSPWYVRFGKFQGVLKTKEKVVNICVNGEEANFHMFLDHKGEAYFLKEVDVEEGESLSYPCSSSSGDETEGQLEDNRRQINNSKSCAFEVDSTKTEQIDKSNGKLIERTTSRRAKILGLVFGRRSMKENDFVGDKDVRRADSLERAELAANLLEVKWSTNLAIKKPKKDNALQFSAPDMPEGQSQESLGGSSTHGNGQLGVGTQSVLESYIEETTLNISCLRPSEENAETSTSNERVTESKCEVASDVSKNVDEAMVVVSEGEENAKGGVSGITDTDLQVPEEEDACPGKSCHEEEVFNGKSVALPGCALSEDGRTEIVQSFIYCESSESSMTGKDETRETLYVSSGGSGKLHVHAELLHASTDPLSELAEDLELEPQPVEGSGSNYNVLFEGPAIGSETYTETVHMNPILGSSEEVESQSTFTASSFSNSLEPFQDEKNTKDEGFTSKLLASPESTSHSVPMEASNVPQSIGIKEEKFPYQKRKEEEFIFGDIDEFKIDEVERIESNFQVQDIEDCPSYSQEDIEELNESIGGSNQSYLSPEIQNTSTDSSEGNMRVLSSPIGIAESQKVAGKQVEHVAESLPIMRSHALSFGANGVHCLSHSLDSNSEALKWNMQIKDDSTSLNLHGEKGQQLAPELSDIKDALMAGGLKDVPANAAIGDPSNARLSPSGSWRWPFSFRRSRSQKDMQPTLHDATNSDAENASETKLGEVIGTDMPEPKAKVGKKMVRTLRPTSEQLASLSLKEGRNIVTFTFLTPMLGKQQVDARIYLWKWNTRIVISDVDGTITRSDVLGQFMPLVGVDWSQTGVAHLFSAIKENGYQMLFLSARAISQAYHTRRFLFNLKQDGKALPDGPVLISPDGLFPSLYREVIRRAPHEFKIACLEEIKSLFPSDCNPFYAGFGNRDTDEMSYLKVGIPKGKIFTINPKGEIAVNRRIDTKSYKSLHVLVHGMFPSTTSSSSEQEDYNTWNFWKLPPPDIDH